MDVSTMTPSTEQSKETVRYTIMTSSHSQDPGHRRRRPTHARKPRRPVGPWFLALGLVAFTTLASTASLHAAPTISGDVDQIVTVTPADCPGCSAFELDKLERGVGMMLTEMRHAAVDGEVCVAEAALARDMAVLSFEAYRLGAITEGRWRDSLRAKAGFAGALTDFTIDTMLLSFRERLEERFGIDIPPGSLQALQTDIYASAKLAKLFDALGQGEWGEPPLAARGEDHGCQPRGR